METRSVESILALSANKQRVISVVGSQLDSFVGIIDGLIMIVSCVEETLS